MPILNYIRQTGLSDKTGMIFYVSLLESSNIALTKLPFSHGHIGLETSRLYSINDIPDLVEEVGRVTVDLDSDLYSNIIVIDDTNLRIRAKIFNRYRKVTNVINLSSDYLRENYANCEEVV